MPHISLNYIERMCLQPIADRGIICDSEFGKALSSRSFHLYSDFSYMRSRDANLSVRDRPGLTGGVSDSSTSFHANPKLTTSTRLYSLTDLDFTFFVLLILVNVLAEKDIAISVCVCVCVRERERATGRGRRRLATKISRPKWTMKLATPHPWADLSWDFWRTRKYFASACNGRHRNTSRRRSTGKRKTHVTRLVGGGEANFRDGKKSKISFSNQCSRIS